MNKHGIRLITAVVTSSVIVTPVLAAPSVDDLKKEKASKQNEVSSLQSQLTTLMGKVNTLESELIQTGEDITKAQSDLVVAAERKRTVCSNEEGLLNIRTKPVMIQRLKHWSHRMILQIS